MVPVGRAAAAGRADDSVGYQQAALRYAERDHGGEEKRDCGGHARIAGRAGGVDPTRGAHLRAAQNEENGIYHRDAEGNRDKSSGKIEARSACALTTEMKILLITEQRDAKWNKVSFETLAAAQQIASDAKGSLTGVVVGKGIGALADELAGYQLDEAFLVENALLE